MHQLPGTLVGRPCRNAWLSSDKRLGPVRPSVPCCFGAGRCSCYSSVSSSSSRWADGIEKVEKVGKKKDIFSRNSEGTLGTFSVRFCGMFVLPCLAVLVPGGALATLLLAAAAATAVLVPGGAFGQQQQQVSWWEIEKVEKIEKKTFFLGIQKGR